ncbi:TPA: hypothetical protein ACW7QV_003365 [Citrobacter braakii]
MQKDKEFKTYEYVIHTSVGTFRGFAPVELKEPFDDGVLGEAFALLKKPTDLNPSIYVRLESVIALECNEIKGFRVG